MPKLALEARQLSAAIGRISLHALLPSKLRVERVLDVFSRRHRTAQMAGHASVEFYVGLVLKGWNERNGKVDAGRAEVTEEAASNFKHY